MLYRLTGYQLLLIAYRETDRVFTCVFPRQRDRATFARCRMYDVEESSHMHRHHAYYDATVHGECMATVRVTATEHNSCVEDETAFDYCEHTAEVRRFVESLVEAISTTTSRVSSNHVHYNCRDDTNKEEKNKPRL